MGSARPDGQVVDDLKVHVKLKISALWTSAMLLHLRGLFRALRAGEAARDAGGANGTTRADDSESVGGDFGDAGDPECNDLPVAGAEARVESLAQHHSGRALARDHPSHDVELALLHFLRNR